MNYKELDCVQLIRDIPEENLFIGMIGAIIMSFEKYPNHFMIEFCDDKGATICDPILSSDDFILYE